MACVPASNRRSRRLPSVPTAEVAWLLLFSAMALGSPRGDVPSLVCILALAALQLAESRTRTGRDSRGNWIFISLKLVLCWLIIGYTDAINSSFYPVLLVPVVSAATTTGPLATAIFTLLACLAYLSFLLFLDWSAWDQYQITWKELLLRIIFLPIVGYLTYTLSRANRENAARYQATAESLARANESLQAAEEAVRRSDRLAALGQLTAGLAHELRNPMGTIRASAEVLHRHLPSEDPMAHELAGYITAEVDRANSLITRFLEFARPLSIHRITTELHPVLDRAVTQFERMSSGPKFSVFKNYAPEVPPLPLHGEWMERVIYNLLVNAAEASPPGATVTLRTRLVNEQVEVAVIDRGSGISQEHQASIFNPFFTTKQEGVGLGLAIVSKIVDEHHGKILVESEPGKGSLFRVLLPTTPLSEHP